MAVSFVLATAERTSLANKLNDDLDDGSLKIYTAADGLLSTHTLPDKASNTVANGVITFGAIANVNAVGTGAASYFTLCNSGGTELCRGNISTSGATLNLNTTAIVTGGPVAITSLTVTVPAGT